MEWLLSGGMILIILKLIIIAVKFANAKEAIERDNRYKTENTYRRDVQTSNANEEDILLAKLSITIYCLCVEKNVTSINSVSEQQILMSVAEQFGIKDYDVAIKAFAIGKCLVEKEINRDGRV